MPLSADLQVSTEQCPTPADHSSAYPPCGEVRVAAYQLVCDPNEPQPPICCQAAGYTRPAAPE